MNKANLDCTGKKVVRRGSVVEWPLYADVRADEGLPPVRVVVERVRDGEFWHSGWASPSFTPCNGIRVVS